VISASEAAATYDRLAIPLGYSPQRFRSPKVDRRRLHSDGAAEEATGTTSSDSGSSEHFFVVLIISVVTTFGCWR
jgi:hypothetical protein